MGQEKKDIIYTWKDFLEATNSIAVTLNIRWILNDISILAVREGGVALGIFLASKLDMSLYFIKAKSYKSRKKLQVRIGKVPSGLVGGSKVILVDDIRETGDTLKKVKEKLIRKHIVIVDEVVLVQKTSKQGWYVFPWEKK